MLFLHPMWDNESQRIGMQRCSKAAYLVHGYGELIGFLGLLTLLGTIIYLAYQGIFGSFNSAMWWLLCVPFGMGVVSETLVQASWAMVGKRGFEYDYDSRLASWLEHGQRITYKCSQQGDAVGGASRCH